MTFDNKNFRVVDLSGREYPSTIKDVIFSQLEIPQNEREHCTFHLTEIGQKEIGVLIYIIFCYILELRKIILFMKKTF